MRWNMLEAIRARLRERSEIQKLRRVVNEERLRQAEVEAERQRDGGIYDAILNRWVSNNETK